MFSTITAVFVSMPDGSVFRLTNLLGDGDDNTKLRKGGKMKYATAGLSLAPHNSSGYQVCPNASPGCIKGCIFTAGYAHVFPSVNRGRVARTRLFFSNRPLFMAMLVRDIRRAERKARKQRKRLAVRLNVFSDLPWEKLVPEVLSMFPKVQFYDYTKSFARAKDHALGKLPKNYHLTFSRSETNGRDALTILQMGGNVAVVFDRGAKDDLPAQWSGYRVVNGDETDLRFLDDEGVVVGLYAKGQGRKDSSGFVVPTVEGATGRIALTVV